MSNLKNTENLPIIEFVWANPSPQLNITSFHTSDGLATSMFSERDSIKDFIEWLDRTGPKYKGKSLMLHIVLNRETDGN